MNKIELINNANAQLAKDDCESARLLFKKAYDIDPRCGHTLLAYLKASIKAKAELSEIDEIISKLALIDKGFAAAGLLYLDCSLDSPRLSFKERVEKLAETWPVFSTGSEIDWLFWDIGGSRLVHRMKETQPEKPYSSVELIPRNLFYYFDKQELPDDVRRLVDTAASSKIFNVCFFNKETARLFLCQEYGKDAVSLFDGLRHPSEESDFIRFHAVQKYGGFWSDVDERLDVQKFIIFLQHLPRLSLLVSQSQATGGPLQSCFFGSTAGHPVLKRCLDLLYHNCRHHPNLSMWLKTGPGPLTRAVIERYTIKAIEDEMQCPTQLNKISEDDMISITSANELRTFLIPYEPSYRNDSRDWRIFEAQNSSR